MKEFDIQSLVRENVRKLKPYSSARDEFQGDASVYLDANENPNNTGYNRYPDPHQVALKKKIGSIKNVDIKNIFIGNGSDEPIDLLIRAFCSPDNDNVLIPEPTYGMYSVSANINAVTIRKVTLTKDFDIDTEVIAKATDANTRIIFLCSPNNPTGNLLTREKIISVISSFKGIVVLDEAYIDFTDSPGFLNELTSYPNLVILQTLSKAWGLAGLRLGMCFAHTEIIEVLDKIKPPYNINIVTQAIVLEELGKEIRKNDWVKMILTQRDVLIKGLRSIPMVEKIYPSDANFLLVKVKDARKTYHDLTSMGIIVRDRSSVILCDECLRITVGNAPENKTLIDALATL